MDVCNAKKRLVTKVYPWYKKEEFLCVYEALFSEDRLQRLWGCNKVEVWKNRYYPAIPAGIDATAVLLRSVVHDELYQEGLSICKMPELCQMYSMSLIRFINIVTEFAQGHGVATPVRTAAVKLDIPDWIVNLRHSATHSRMPSIGMLREGTQAALTWLHREYWLQMGRSFSNFNSIQKKEVETTAVKELIITYMDFQTIYLKSQTSYNKKDVEKLLQTKRTYDRILGEIRNHLIHQPEKFLDALVQPSFFLMSPEQTVIALSKSDTEFWKNDVLQLPKPLLKFWKPLIRIINIVDQMPLLLSQLLKSKNLKPSQQKMACAWALKLIKVVLTEEQWDFSDPIVSIYFEHNWLFNWQDVLALCFMNASKYMTAVILTCINEFFPPLTEEGKNNLLVMLVMYLGSFPFDDEKSEKKLQTWKNIEEDAELEWLARKDGKVLYTANAFEVIEDDVDWAIHPLGVVTSESNDDFVIGIPPEITIGDSHVVGDTNAICEDTAEKSTSDMPSSEQLIVHSNECPPLETQPVDVEVQSPIVSSESDDDVTSDTEDMMLY